MARRFNSGLCVHCGGWFESLTGDHILPESWYPDSTPAGLEKWQAPSCDECNARYGKLERRLLQLFGLGVDPWIEGGEGIGERALRSYDPRVAKNETDRRHRENARERLRRNLKHVDSIPYDAHVFPNVGAVLPADDGTYSGESLVWAQIEEMVQKFVRGISFLRTGSVMPMEYVVRVLRPEAYRLVPAELLLLPAEVFDRGAGFRVERRGVDVDSYTALYRIFLWGRFEFYATVAPVSAP